MRVRVIMVAVGASVATAVGVHAQDSAGVVERSIQAVLDRQTADWNRGDLEAFLEGYWKSPRVVFQSGGDRYDGWEAMRERYRKRYQASGRAMGKVAFSGVEIVPLGADSALVRGRWRLTLPDGSNPGGLFTLIFRRLPEGWKIIHDHTSSEVPKASAVGVKKGG